MDNLASCEIGQVKIVTTNGRSASIEELTDRAVNKIIYVGDHADPKVAEQARVFRERIRSVIDFYMREAVTADRVNRLTLG